MSRQVANVNIITNSWEDLILQLNELLNAFSKEIVTANTTLGSTGNTSEPRIAQLIGSFGTNNIVVTNSIKGGNLSGSTADLNVLSNIAMPQATNIKIGNSTINSVSNNNTFNILTPTSNFTVNNSVFSLSVGNNNLFSNATHLRIFNNTESANINPVSISIGNSTVNTTSVAVGNVVANTSTIRIGNSTVFSTSDSTKVVSGGYIESASYANVATDIFVGNTVNIKNETRISVDANTNVGTNIVSPIIIYSFPKASYSSGKFEVQVKNGLQTQISEMILAHDGTTAQATVYATVCAPPNANGFVSTLGTFSANVNGSNVDVLFNQTTINSSVKIVSQLIK